MHGRRDRVRHGSHEQGVAVARRLRRDARGKDAACARPVLDHHLLAPGVAQAQPHDPGEIVRLAARRKRHDQPDRLGREALRVGKGQGRVQAGCGGTQQDQAACKLSSGNAAFQQVRLDLREELRDVGIDAK